MRIKFRALKSFFGILLLLAFIARPSIKIGIVGYYGLNVKSIVEKYCVNKNKPVLKCNGKCYLKKKLEFSASDTSTEVNKINFAEAFIPVFLNIPISTPLDTFEYLPSTQNIKSKKNLFERLLLFKIEYPPEYS